MDTKTRRIDPVVFVVGNATLLGIGYLAQRRFNAAAAALTGTATLLVSLVWEPGTSPWPSLMGAWWVVVVLESIASSRKRTPEEPDREARTPRSLWGARLSVVALAASMLVAGYLVRDDAEGIVDEASQSHRDGDCARATATIEQLNPAHRIVAGDVVADAAAQVEACGLLEEGLASDDEEGDPQELIDALERYLDHDGALWRAGGLERARLLLERSLADRDHVEDRETAFQQVVSTVRETPELADEARELLEAYLAGLGMDLTACRFLETNEWVAARASMLEVLSPVSEAAAAQAPVHMIDCAREHVAQHRFDEGIEQYLDLLEEYPDHELAAQAQEELSATEADQERSQEYAELSELLASGAYCLDPIPFSRSAAFDSITSGSVWFYGPDEVEPDFPEELSTRSVAEATAVACVRGPENGSFIETCEYRLVMGSDNEVDLYTSVFRVEVYSLRTGELVESYTEEFDGSCPETISYFYDPFGSYNTFPDTVTVPYDPDRDNLFDQLL